MRRIWMVVLASMAVLVTAVISIGRWAVPERQDDLWIELAKAAIQLLVVVGLGGVVSAVLRMAEVSRERRRIRDERRFAIFQQLVSAYRQLKFVRRDLRMVGLRDGPGELRPEQVAALRAGMSAIVEVDLTLEQISRELDARSIFDKPKEINQHLGQLLKYVGHLVEEWERHGAGFWPDKQTAEVRDLVALQAFLGAAKNDFRPNAASPMGWLELIVHDELLAGGRA